MSTVTCTRTGPVERQADAGEPRRVILTDPAGKRLAEMPLEARPAGARFPARGFAAQLLAATSPNGSDRPSTGDALHVVVGKRACFGYVVDAATVRWFSHPRLARADAFSSLPDREVRALLYNLHSGDPEPVSEIIWETSGRISAHRVPALPAGIDPGTRGSLERARDAAAYWRVIGQILASGMIERPASQALVTRRKAQPAPASRIHAAETSLPRSRSSTTRMSWLS